MLKSGKMRMRLMKRLGSDGDDEKESVIKARGKDDELARVNWSGMKLRARQANLKSIHLVSTFTFRIRAAQSGLHSRGLYIRLRTWYLSPILLSSKPKRAYQPTMQNFEDADVVGEMSAPRAFGQDYFFRVVDVLKPGRILETEVEVLGFGSSASSSRTYRGFC